MREKKAETAEVADLITKIRDRDDKVRAQGLLDAAKVGAPAVKPLAAVMSDPDFEVARAARRGLWGVVRHVGRPGADNERKPVVSELVALLADNQPMPVRREVMWMLSELGGDESVEPVAGLLSNAELREDARMVLERLPGRKSLAALQRGLQTAPPDFKSSVAESLRVRGVRVPGVPSRKLVPTRKTNLKPVEQPSR